MLFPGGSPTLGSPVRGSLPVGQVQQVLFGPLLVQQQQQMQQQQVQAAAQQVGSREQQQQQQQQQQVQPRQQQPQVQAQFQSPPPGPRTGGGNSSYMQRLVKGDFRCVFDAAVGKRLVFFHVKVGADILFF